MKRVGIAWACWFGLISNGTLAQEPAPAPAAAAVAPKPVVVVRLDSPDQMGRSVLKLFEGSRAPDPASALAAWKRATREPNRFGKATEALIASFNPRMVEEFRIFQDAEIRAWPVDGRVGWAATLPHDDGSIGALATAFVLTDGAAEGPFRGVAVDRLGPPGSALMVRAPHSLLMASDRAGLEVAWERSERGFAEIGAPGIAIEAGPGLAEPPDRSPSLARIRVAELLRSGTIRNPTARVELVGPTARATIRFDLDDSLRSVVRPARVDPAWLDWIPRDRAMAAFAVGVGPDPEGWASAFALFDRLERLDPARANLAPARLRLDLLARAVGIRSEADILPHLKGLSGWVGSDGRESTSFVLLAHFDSEAVAERVVARIKREPEGRIAQVEGKPVRLTRIGPSAVFDWGDGSLAASIAARERPEFSAAAGLRESWARGNPPLSVGAIWPARVPGLVPDGSPLAKAIAEGPPVTWTGELHGSAYALVAEWPGLDATVRRFLELIPLDPPPDH